MEPRRLAEEFARRLREALGGRLVRVVLFGSVARGDYEPDSDVDILVVVRGDAGEARETARDVAFRLMEESGYSPWLEHIVMDVEGYNRAAREGRYFVNAVAREGVVLYDDGSNVLEDPSPGPSEAELEDHLTAALGSVKNAVRAIREEDAGLVLGGYRTAYLLAFDAVENVMRALVKSRGYRRLPRRHGGWQDLFARDFVRTGVVPLPLWERAKIVLERRPVVAYEPARPEARVSREEAVEAVKTALELLRLAVEHLAGEGKIRREKRDYYVAAIDQVSIPA